MSWPIYTKTWRNDTYDALSPTNPGVSAAGKVVLITGGGQGIGAEVTKTFAIAGATKIAIVGRTPKDLTETKVAVEKAYPGTTVNTYPVDIVDGPGTAKAFVAAKNGFGPIDILVHCAAYLSTHQTLAESDPEEWWKGFEVNIRGSFNVIQAFLATASPDAAVVNVSAAAAHLPGMPKFSGYQASKLAALRIFDTLQAEHREMRVLNISPGVIATKLLDKSKAATGAELPLDTIQLAATFIVWAASPEAAYLKGRFLWANWDITEIKEKFTSSKDPKELTVGLFGLVPPAPK
jgi:NAD(P)-dependent dehydrogenase (short-subunit alcohol dehydrogenase family)